MADTRKRTMTPQQLHLCRLFLSGMTQVDAYLSAGYADQGNRAKNVAAASQRFKAPAIQRYIDEFKGMVDEGVRTELGIEEDDPHENHLLADRDDRTLDAICNPLDDIEAELLEETVLTRAGMLKRLESLANHAHRLHDYEGQIKPLQEISKIMGFYRPSQVEVSAVNFQLDLSGSGAIDTDADELDPETVAMAKKVAPAMISQRSDDEDDESFSVFKTSPVEVLDLEDL